MALRRLRFALVLLVAAVLAGEGTWLWMNHRPLRLSGTTLEFVALGPVDGGLLQETARRTAAFYHLPYRVLSAARPLPGRAYLHDRGQYETDALLDLLPAGPSKTQRLYLTEADVTCPGMNFLFGQSRPDRRIAVLSFARFRRAAGRSQAGAEALRERVTKIAVHELGHSLGFEHCSDARCVMRFSNSLGEVDETRAAFCAGCARRVR